MAPELRIDIAAGDVVRRVLDLFDHEGELSGYAEAALADRLGRIFVALDGDVIAGALITREVVTATRDRRGGIDELLVHHEYRDNGIGRLLMAAAEAYWQDVPGVVGMQLTVVASNEPAVHLYESLGYREVQRRVRMYKDW